MRALVIIDIQNEYSDKGKWTLPRFEQAAARAAHAIAAARGAGVPVMHVRHEITSTEEYGFVPGSAGAQIHSAVAPGDGEAVIVKHHPNSFLETDLAARLDALGDGPVAFAGMMTSTCVDSTVRAASDLGLEAVLVAVFQPHLYSRTQHLAVAFGRALAAADVVCVLDVYPARERAQDFPGISGLTIAEAAVDAGGAAEVLWMPTFDDAERVLAGRLRAGDLCMILGAGDVRLLGERLIAQ